MPGRIGSRKTTLPISAGGLHVFGRWNVNCCAFPRAAPAKATWPVRCYAPLERIRPVPVRIEQRLPAADTTVPFRQFLTGKAQREPAVEIGAETAYEVRVRNEGSKGANNVGLSCELMPGVELLGAKGPADYLAEKGLIVFKSLAELAPGKTAVYRIHVRGTRAGNQRFRARLASDSIHEPLVCEEMTKFYKD